MVVIDFNRTGLDNTWTMTGKHVKDYSMGLMPSDSWDKSLHLEEDMANANHVISQDHFDSWAVPAVTVNELEGKRPETPDATEFPKQDETGCENESTTVEQGSSSDISSVITKEEEQEDQHVEDSTKSAVEHQAQEENDGKSEKDRSLQKSPDWACIQCLDGIAALFRFITRPPTCAVDKPNDAADATLQRALLESAAEARERLKPIMHLYNARARPVQADGNCQFRALSLQLDGTEDNHASLRARIVEQLEKEPERYKDFVYEEYSDYVKRVAQVGQWGDNVTLQAASDVLGKEIRVLTDQPGAGCVDVSPSHMTSNAAEKPLCVTFVGEMHYDAAEFLES